MYLLSGGKFYMHKNSSLRCLFIQQRSLKPIFRASTVLDTQNSELPVLRLQLVGRKTNTQRYKLEK